MVGQKKMRIWLVGMVIFVAAGYACAGTIYVNGTIGNNSFSGANPAGDAPDGPKATIQSGIDAAVAGDEVVVAQGTYQESVDFNGKAITVGSTDPDNWEVIQNTVIDGRYNNSCVLFVSGEGAGSVIEGFTIKKGAGKYYYYSGYSRMYGGGIICNNSSPIIRYCCLTENGYRKYNYGESYYADHGGAIAIRGASSAVIDNCLIYGNGVSNTGGAIYLDSTTPADMQAVISHCTIGDNISGGSYDYTVDCRNTSPTITHTIIWDENEDNVRIANTANIRYSCIRDVRLYGQSVPVDITGSNGNIAKHPWFVRDEGYCLEEDSSGNCLDYVPVDFSLHLNSSCYNAGDPAITGTGRRDLNGNPRVMAGRVDIGAFEISPYIKATAPAAGEILASYSLQNIEWESLGIEGLVDIAYSINSGVDWLTVAEGTLNDGSYAWQLPGVASPQEYIVKVVPSDAIDGATMENSSPFSVVPYSDDPNVTSQWPTLGGNIQRTGRSEYNGPVLGCVKWKYDAPTEAVYNSIAIGAAGNIHIACKDGTLYTINPDGALQWQYDSGSAIMSSPTIGPDGTVYFGNEDGFLYSISKDGDLRWRKKTSGWVYSSIAISDNMIYAASLGGVVYALKADGSNLWQYEVQGPGRIDGAILAPVTISNTGSVLIASMYLPKLYALDPQTGAQRWVVDFTDHGADGGSIFIAPVVKDNGDILVTLLNDNTFYRVQEQQEAAPVVTPNHLALTRQAAYPDATCWTEPVVAGDGSVYVSMDDPWLRAFNPDGTSKWTTHLGSVGGLSMSIAANGHIYAAGDDGSLYLVDSAGGELARFDGDQWLAWPVIGSDGTVYLSDSAGSLWAVSADSCDAVTANLHRQADFNGDRVVDLRDFAIVASTWLECTDPSYIPAGQYKTPCDTSVIYLPGDANRDMFVNVGDMAEIMRMWLASE